MLLVHPQFTALLLVVLYLPNALNVVLSISTIFPPGVYFPCSIHSKNLSAISFVIISPFASVIESIVASVIDVSSDQVPFGTLCPINPTIDVIGFLINFSLFVNSTGTPIASPIAKPIIPSFELIIFVSPVLSIVF